jgi:hypothetical protein
MTTTTITAPVSLTQEIRFLDAWLEVEYTDADELFRNLEEMLELGVEDPIRAREIFSELAQASDEDLSDALRATWIFKHNCFDRLHDDDNAAWFIELLKEEWQRTGELSLEQADKIFLDSKAGS